MDNSHYNKNYMSNQSSTQGSQLTSSKFLEKKKQALREEFQRRKRQQQIEDEKLKQMQRLKKQQQLTQRYHKWVSNSQNINRSSNTNKLGTSNSNISNYNKQEDKKLTGQQVLKNGKIVKILEKTLTPDQYKIQCQYEQQIIELIASKQQIIKNDIIPLLDFYQKILGLR